MHYFSIIYDCNVIIVIYKPEFAKKMFVHFSSVIENLFILKERFCYREYEISWSCDCSQTITLDVCTVGDFCYQDQALLSNFFSRFYQFISVLLM